MSIKRQFGNGVAWMTAGGWIEQALNFIVFILLARLLGAEAFGLMAMASVFVILSEVLVRDSLSEFLIATENPSKGHYNAAFWQLATVGCILTTAILFASDWIAQFYGQAAVKTMLMVLTPTILMVALEGVPVVILRRDLRFEILAIRAVSGVVVGGGVGLFMALNGYGVWSLVAQRLVLIITNFVIVWAAVPWRPSTKYTKTEFREVLRFGTSVLALRAADLTRTQVPTVIISAYLGPTVLGLFSIAWRMIELASFLIVTPLRMVSQPAFAAMERAGDNASELLLDISRLSGLVAFPAFFGLSILSLPFLTLLFGDHWIDAAPILAIIAFVGIYLTIEKVNEAFCLAAGRANGLAAVAWIEVLLAIALVWGAAPWGIEGMSVAFLLSFLVLWPVRFWIVARIADVSIARLLTTHIKPFLCALVMAFCVKAMLGILPEFGALGTIVVAFLAGLAVYAVLTTIFMRDRVMALLLFLQSNRKSKKGPVV